MKLTEVDYNKSYEYVYLYKRMWKYVKPYLFRGILGILMAIPVGLLDSIPSLAIKFYFDYVINAKDPVLAQKIVLVIPFAIVGFAVLQGALMYFNNYLNDWTGRKMTIGLKKDLFEKLLKLEPAFYDKNSSGLVMSRFLSDPDGACTGIITNLKDLLSTVCSSIALVGVLIYTSWQLSIFAIFVLASSFIPVTFIKKLVRKVSHEGMQIGSNVSTNFYETFNGNRIITSFNLQKYQFDKFYGQLVDSFNLSMGYSKRAGWLSPAMFVVASFGIAGVMWYGNYLIINKTITAGSLFAFITALILLYKPVRTLGNTMAGMQSSFVSMNRVVDLFDFEPSIQDKPDAIKIPTINDSIKFENVWFEYEKDAPVLRNINIEVKIGDSLALVGNSGGGKTTIANLIPRFYDIKSGSIKIDNIDIRDIELNSLRQNIAVVFQDNFLFSGTIKDNIILGKFNAGDEEIVKALKDSYLDEFIASLPEGLDTEIGERGVRLSGGQKQRLAIARAMIKNAPVVILDEATSALDNKSEAIVQKALDKLMENRTVIVIAHRLSTIQNATRIAVVNDGQIVEIGTHEELLENPNGAYTALYKVAQFKQNEDSSEQTEELQEV
jgi:subfamily B ATP-binding cassette protein MsbA